MLLRAALPRRRGLYDIPTKADGSHMGRYVKTEKTKCGLIARKKPRRETKGSDVLPLCLCAGRARFRCSLKGPKQEVGRLVTN